jgi:hypothetical protein
MRRRHCQQPADLSRGEGTAGRLRCRMQTPEVLERVVRQISTLHAPHHKGMQRCHVLRDGLGALAAVGQPLQRLVDRVGTFGEITEVHRTELLMPPCQVTLDITGVPRAPGSAVPAALHPSRLQVLPGDLHKPVEWDGICSREEASADQIGLRLFELRRFKGFLAALGSPEKPPRPGVVPVPATVVAILIYAGAYPRHAQTFRMGDV